MSPCSTIIAGTGSYAPATVLTNEDLAKRMDTSDEWISSRTGIRERRIAADSQAMSDLAVPAARRALEHLAMEAAVQPDHVSIRAKLAEDYAKSQWTPSLDEQVDVNAQKTAAERDERRRMYRDAALQELKLAEIAAVEAELRAETAHIYAMHCLDVAFLHAQQEGNR